MTLEGEAAGPRRVRSGVGKRRARHHRFVVERQRLGAVCVRRLENSQLKRSSFRGAGHLRRQVNEALRIDTHRKSFMVGRMIKNWLALLFAFAACSEAGRRGPIELQGVVELHEQRLGFEVPGRLKRLAVQRGQRIEAGQVLAALDDGMDTSLRDARMEDARAAQASLELIRAGTRGEDLHATEAQLRGALATERTARKQLERARTLRGSGVVPQAQLDDAEAQAARAGSERETLEQRLSAQKTGARLPELRQASARSRSAQAAAAAEEARLARYVLRASAAGVVLDTTAEPGEVLAAGTPAVVVGETKRPYVDVFVPQQDLQVFAPAQRRLSGSTAVPRFCAAESPTSAALQSSPRATSSARASA